MNRHHRADYRFEANLDRYWVSDSTPTCTELGYTEIANRQKAYRRTIAWERKHPPEKVLEPDRSKLLDYKDEGAILANLKS